MLLTVDVVVKNLEEEIWVVDAATTAACGSSSYSSSAADAATMVSSVTTVDANPLILN